MKNFTSEEQGYIDVEITAVEIIEKYIETEGKNGI